LQLFYVNVCSYFKKSLKAKKPGKSKALTGTLPPGTSLAQDSLFVCLFVFRLLFFSFSFFISDFFAINEGI